MNLRLYICLTITTASLLFCLPASAQGRHDAKVQFLTAGLVFQPGFMDSTSSESQASSIAYAQATTIRLGYQHRVAPGFFMSAEVEAGAQYIKEHSATLDARSTPAETAFAWQIGMLGRWVSAESGLAPTLGAGLALFTAGLESAGLQALSFDLRAGTYFWKKDDFALIELGYSVPFIAGLNRPTDFSAEQDPAVPEDWTFHRFSLSFSYGW